MNQKQAEMLARAVGGDTHNSGGGVWLVKRYRGADAIVVFSGDCVCEYENEEAFDEGRATATIELADIDDDREYVIVDDEGNVFYEDDELERGWDDAFEAERQARALESRGEGSFQVKVKDED